MLSLKIQVIQSDKLLEFVPKSDRATSESTTRYVLLH